MIGSDVEDHGDIGMEIIHVFKLKARKLYHIYVVVLPRHLKGEAPAYVAARPTFSPASLSI